MRVRRSSTTEVPGKADSLRSNQVPGLGSLSTSPRARRRALASPSTRRVAASAKVWRNASRALGGALVAIGVERVTLGAARAGLGCFIDRRLDKPLQGLRREPE